MKSLENSNFFAISYVCTKSLQTKERTCGAKSILGLYQIKLAAQPCSPPVSWQPLPWPLAGLQGSALRNGIPTYFITPVVTCSIAAGGDCGRVTGYAEVILVRPNGTVTSGLTIRELSRIGSNRKAEYNHFYRLPVNTLR